MKSVNINNMKYKTSYWFYFEPYTIIFNGKCEKVVYNTLNSSYIKCTAPNVLKLLDELSIPENGYCIPINIIMAKDKAVVEFVREIRSSFSGDIIADKNVTTENKPYIFMPMLRLYNSVERIKKERGQSLGEVILRNLNEVTCFLPGICNNGCEDCESYFKQMIHCSNFTGNNLCINDYMVLFDNLDACGVNKVNIVINSLFENTGLNSIIDKLTECSFKKEFYLSINNLNDNVRKLFIPDSTVNISFHLSSSNKSKIEQTISLYRKYSIDWNCIVADELDIELLEKTFYLEKIKITPFYNKRNIQFFEQFVYSSLDDIIAYPIEKRQIFRRQALNEFFFGKLYIIPSGDTYSNMNFPPIGNIKNQSLGEIVYAEIENSKAWLKVREEGVCKDCVNKYLCPSISNYELSIGKENLCHINA